MKTGSWVLADSATVFFTAQALSDRLLLTVNTNYTRVS